MQWTVTTAAHLKSVEFWTPMSNLHYTAYLYTGSVTNPGPSPVVIKEIDTQEKGYYVIPMDNILLTPGTWNVQIKGNTPVMATTGPRKIIPNLQISPNTTFFRASDSSSWQDAISRDYGIPIRIRLNTNANGTNTPQPQFANITATATPIESGYVQITPTSPYMLGQIVQLQAIPNKGYHFVSWSTGSDNSVLTITASKTATITAIFAPDVYNISLHDNIGTIYSETASFGETIAIPLQTSDNLTVESILVNGEPLANTSTVVVLTNIDKDYNIEVTYKQIKHISMQVGSLQMFINGETSSLDAPPIIMNGRTLVPLRVIAEALGAEVNWDPATKQVTIWLNGDTILLAIGNSVAMVNGSPVTIDVAPILSNGRTMVPLRFIAETLNAQVSWDSDSKTVSVVSECLP